MPFFLQTYLPTEAALFPLLSELDRPPDKHQQQQQQQQQQQHHPDIRCIHRPQAFTPRFDVTETAEAYELYGEVPGLQQGDLDIQFADAQTLVIKGKTERRFNAHTHSTTTAAAPEVAPAAAETTSSPRSALGATVADVDDDDDYDQADAPLATDSRTAKGRGVGSSTPPPSPPPPPPIGSPATPRLRYWAAERQVGEFARSFAFAQRIEQDLVSAGLGDGVLRVVVPKSSKSKRVAVGGW